MESGTTTLDPRRFSEDRPPAMVLGGLTITRALGLARIPVIVASSVARESAFVSRYCAARLRLPAHEGRAAVADRLLAAGERLATGLGRRVPLYYGNDDWQRLVQDYRQDLERHYAMLLNDPHVAEAVIEKDLFQRLALERGLPVPRTLDWDAVDRWAGPVLVKPRTKFEWEASAVFLRLFGREGKARIFESGAALLADAAARELHDQLVIQEYIPGDDRTIWSFHGFADEEGRLLDWFIGRKLRTYPALTGISTFVELARDAELAELGRSIAGTLPLKGVFKIDLKRDPRSGRLRVLEINARYNLWHYLGAANGVNLARTAYDYLVYGKRPPAPTSYRTRYRWIYLRADWRAYRELSKRGQLRFGAWLGSLLSGPLVCQLFAWSDPLPFFHRLFSRLRIGLPRVPGLLRRWLSTAW